MVATPVPHRTRRKHAFVVAFFAFLVLATAGAISWNPLGFVRLEPAGPWAIAVAFIVLPPAVAVVGWLAATTRPAAIALAAVSGMLTVPAMCGAGVVVLWADRPTDRRVEAVSPDGRFEVVSAQYDTFAGERRVTVEYPDGLFTRAAPMPLFCYAGQFGDGPPAKLEKATFVGPHEVELVLDVGPPHRISFDPGTLRPSRTLDAGCRLDGPNVIRLPYPFR